MNALAKALIDSHGTCGLTGSQWFDHLLNDVLAGFGLRLKVVPSEDVMAHLFDLSGLYAAQVSEHAPFTDLLGPVHMEMVSHYRKKDSGQFFTPFEVCRMLALQTLGETPVDLESPAVVRICDPAVGAGGMLLAALEHVVNMQGAEALHWVSVTGVDIDLFCARMFPCQVLASLLVHRLHVGELVSYRGNTLGDPRDWDLLCHYSHAEMPSKELSSAGTLEHKNIVAKTAQEAAVGEQLNMF